MAKKPVKKTPAKTTKKSKPEAEQRPDPTVHTTPVMAQSISAPTSTVRSTEKEIVDSSKTKTVSTVLPTKSLVATTDQPPHVIVEARAGTGKTTTLVSALKVLKGIDPGIIPSPQQQAVWDAVKLSHDARTICFVAFNKSIATELQRRVPMGCDAMTMHSMGLKAITRAFGRVEIESNRVYNIIERITGGNIRDMRKDFAHRLSAIESLVALSKQTLSDDLYELASLYDIDLGDRDDTEFIISLVPQVLAKCKDPKHDNLIDFNDMIWLPVVLDLPVFKYDLLLVDEAQDLNRCQQALAKKAGKRLILCGDDKQAIYAFAGADSESLPRMTEELEGCIKIPLTVTRRCGKAIVREAQRFVPDFEAHESNCDGKITKKNLKENTDNYYGTYVQDGDMVLCRCNAPLVSQCFKFLKNGRKATIQGRDIGRGLTSMIKKMKAKTVPDLIGKLDDYKHKEVEKENAKRIPSEVRIQAIKDKVECLQCFTENCETVDQVLAKIESIFTDNKDQPGIRLSSIHKAKGLEATRVFILQGKGMTGPPADKLSESDQQQEKNLRYVAVTRAIQELVYVNDN